jgi:hypothetical protein
MLLTVSAKRTRPFDPKKFLSIIGGGRELGAFSPKQTIFAQGDAANDASSFSIPARRD